MQRGEDLLILLALVDDHTGLWGREDLSPLEAGVLGGRVTLEEGHPGGHHWRGAWTERWRQ